MYTSPLINLLTAEVKDKSHNTPKALYNTNIGSI